MNTNIDKFEKYEQLTENKQRLNKRKNTEEFAYVLLKIQQKRNRKEIIKNDNQYSLLNKELWTNNLIKLSHKSLIFSLSILFFSVFLFLS